MSNTVLVTGASGFVGRAVLDLLLQKGYHVRALVRSTESPLPAHPNLVRVIGDVRDLHSIEAGLAGITHVIHLAARKNDEKDSADTNVEGAKNLIEACRIAGVRHIVNVSTQSARLPKKGIYGSTKEEADTLFHAAHIPVTTLRSSLVYGDKESGVFGTLVRFSKLPFIPMIGNGRARFRPIHRNDLAAIIVQALEADVTTGKIYDVGGPDSVSLDTIANQIVERQGIRKHIVHIPVWVGLLMARVFSVLQHPPLTVSNVRGSAVDIPMDTTLLERDLGALKIRSFAVGLTEIFGVLPSSTEKEATMLLRYVLSGVGRWNPDSDTIELLLQAFKTHHVDGHPIHPRVLHSNFRLGLYDAATKMMRIDCLLQRKLLIAAAIAETQPASADLLLPQDASTFMVVIRCIDAVTASLFKLLCALPLMCSPRSLRTYAGAL